MQDSRADGPTLADCGAVRWVRLAQADVGNALSPKDADRLAKSLVAADRDPTVRTIVLAGEGQHFCTGARLDGSGTSDAPFANLLEARAARRPYYGLFRTLWELETPLVTAVRGDACGIGVSIALVGDLVVMADAAKLVHAFSRNGMPAHAGDPYLLPRLMPLARLMEFAMLGDPLTASTLATWNLVNRVVPVDEVEQVTADLAECVAAGPTRSLMMTKRLYRRALESDLATSLNDDASALALAKSTEDYSEGVRAAIAKQPPTFSGR